MRRRVGRLAYLLTGDADLAEDLTQEAFVRLIGLLGGIREEAAKDRPLLSGISLGARPRSAHETADSAAESRGHRGDRGGCGADRRASGGRARARTH